MEPKFKIGDRVQLICYNENAHYPINGDIGTVKFVDVRFVDEEVLVEFDRYFLNGYGAKGYTTKYHGYILQ